MLKATQLPIIDLPTLAIDIHVCRSVPYQLHEQHGFSVSCFLPLCIPAMLCWDQAAVDDIVVSCAIRMSVGRIIITSRAQIMLIWGYGELLLKVMYPVR